MASSSTSRRLGLTGGSAYKAPVIAATTTNITLSGEQTIDGVACVTDDRVLVKDQTAGAENGIYSVDTGSWTRTLDFDGTGDVVQGTQVYVNIGGSSNGGTVFVLTTSGTVTFDTTVLTFNRTSSGSITPTSNTSSAGQTVFTVATYQPGAATLQVYVNGIRQRVTDDYVETDTTTITFNIALMNGDEVDTFSQIPAASLTSAAASASAVTDSSDYYVATDVEGVLSEIAQAITADNGDASATLTNASSARVQRWNTALTANRTVTLSTSNAKEGAMFCVVRAAGATGNFTLSVGSLATLRAAGEWCVVRYDSGTAAWVLERYGVLPTAELLGLTADNGDASATLTVGTSFRTQRWATTLTADRTATLATTTAYLGARFRIVRAEAAIGNFSLIVSASSATLIRLTPGQFCDVEYTGSAWILVAHGWLRPGLKSTVELFDHFLGQEVDGYKWQYLVGTDSSVVAPIVLASQPNGIARMVAGSNASVDMATNGVQLQSDLNWEADKGGLSFECRVMMSAITNVCVYVGLTDQIAALEMPFTLSGTTLTSNATNAVGVLFDTAATTDDWWLVGVAANVDATQQDAGTAPTASTLETWRIDVSATGVATFYRNGTLVGSAMTGAVTASAPLTPIVAAFSRTTAVRNIDVDYIYVQEQL